MATKVYCDICGQEIKPNSLIGGIMKKMVSYPMIKTDKGEMISKKEGIVSWDLCEECQKAVWEFSAERRKGFEAKKSIIIKKGK